MTSVFADTFYFIALLNAADDAHDAAAAYSTDDTVRLVTTAWVLTELADGLAETPGRAIFAEFVNELRGDARVDVVEPDAGLWQRGIDLYDARRDKGWSLTDCISFVVMTDRKMTDALTGDHHFEQAGFHALLK
jgi:predicted nucleic acid-binding protein